MTLRVSVYGFAVTSPLRQFVENRATELEARAKSSLDSKGGTMMICASCGEEVTDASEPHCTAEHIRCLRVQEACAEIAELAPYTKWAAKDIRALDIKKLLGEARAKGE